MRIELTVAEYRRARDKPHRFVVAPGHADLEFERVLIETDRFLLVEKLGEAGEIAAELAED